MKEIQFSDKFDAIICLDGTLASSDFFSNFKEIPIFAADAAAIKLISMNLDFEKVIGDLDTISKSGLLQKIDETKIVYLPDQETNDFDKTLNYVFELGYRKVLITGIHGGELEHSLNNWSVLKKYMGKLSLCIYENNRYVIPISGSFSLSTFPGEIIGLIPQPKAILTTKGFKWELNNGLLELGVREGARNIATGNKVEVDMIEGSLLIFMNARIPFAPNI